MLGVDPGADHEALRRAYVERAMAFHPDRVADGDADAVATAAHRMRELNEAWEALRDPQRRAEYDRTLVVPGRAAAAAPPGPGDGIHLAAEVAPPAEPAGPWWWAGPAVVLVLVVVGALLVAIVQSLGDDPVPDVEVQAGDRYAPDMCVAVRVGPTAEPVPCDGPSSGRIVDVVPFPRPCRDGDLEPIVLAAESLTLCLAPAPGR